jgi:hypothetical protein
MNSSQTLHPQRALLPETFSLPVPEKGVQYKLKSAISPDNLPFREQREIRSIIFGQRIE